MSQVDEAQLVIRSRAGDRMAFEELVRRTARWLYVRVYLDAGDPHLAEDLVQETFLRAWQRLASLSEPATFRGWLAAISHSAVLDAAKRASRQKRGSFRWLRQNEQRLQALPDSRPSPSESAQAREQRDRLRKLLASLPAEYRDVLALRYLAGADYDTIARQLAISNGSLRGLLQRGMKMLRERMNET